MASTWIRTAETFGGPFLEVDGYSMWSSRRVPVSRRKRYKPTCEAQKRENAKLAERKLARLIHANFTRSDYSITLTYDDYHLPDDDDTLKRDARNFLARLRRLFGRFNVKLKYILVLAHGTHGGRGHMHLVVSGGVPLEEIDKLWKFGMCRVEKLKFGNNGVAGLSDYILKQTEVFSKRWCCSRNLVRPEAVVRDNRISNRDAYALADRATSPARLYELARKIWPGYQLASIQSQTLNQVNGGAYFTLRLIRDDSPYAAPDYEYWSTAWLKAQKRRGQKTDQRAEIKKPDGRNRRRKTE